MWTSFLVNLLNNSVDILFIPLVVDKKNTTVTRRAHNNQPATSEHRQHDLWTSNLEGLLPGVCYIATVMVFRTREQCHTEWSNQRDLFTRCVPLEGHCIQRDVWEALTPGTDHVSSSSDISKRGRNVIEFGKRLSNSTIKPVSINW